MKRDSWKRKGKQILSGLHIAFSMYSRLPAVPCEWTGENLRYVMCFFPLVGAAIGAFSLLWWKVSVLTGLPQTLRTVILLLIPVAVTGGIHLDGMLDTMDASACFGSLDRRIEILKDPHTGAFAVIGACSWFILSYAFLSMMTEELMGSYLAVFVLSRAGSAVSVVLFRQMKNRGSVSRFAANADRRAVLAAGCIYAAAAAGAAIRMAFPEGLVMAAAFVLTLLWYHHKAMKHFGGINGDLAGWFVCISELTMTAALVLAGFFM